MKGDIARLSKIAFGLGLGLTWGIGCFILALIAAHTEYGKELVATFGKLYPGYAASVGGSFWGLLWGFIDGFVGGLFIALFYNLSLCCCCKWCKKSCATTEE